MSNKSRIKTETQLAKAVRRKTRHIIPDSPSDSPPSSSSLVLETPPSLITPPPSPLETPSDEPAPKPAVQPLLVQPPALEPPAVYPEIIDMPPGKKKCPTGYSVFTDKDGVKKCTRKALLKALPPKASSSASSSAKKTLKKPRCPKGQQRNKKTGECEPNK